MMPFKQLTAYAMVLMSCLPTLAGERAATTLARDGWTIMADSNQARLTIGHERLGTLLKQVRLYTRRGKGLVEVRRWHAETTASGRLELKTPQSASIWTFDCDPGELRITSTDRNAVLIGQAPVSKSRRVARLLDAEGEPVVWHGTGEVAGTYGGKLTENPSRLPRQNPECMYFALGQVASSVFHSLFDQATDTAIQFPEQSLWRLPTPGADFLGLTLPLASPSSVRIMPDYFTKILGVPYYVPFDDSVFSRPAMVWCSWTSYYGDVNEEGIVRNTDWLAEHLKPYGFQYVQIDDGYDRGPNEGHYWIEHWDKRKFPRGPAWIAQYVRSKGLHPGLWLVPNAFAGAVEQHPDWYLRDRKGAIVKDYGTPALDSSNPEVLDFLKSLFGTLKGWGFDYYKFDGEHALPKYAPPVDTNRLWDKTTDPLQVYRQRLEAIRQVVGPNTFIEGCPAGTPLNGIGFFNSYFNGQDVYNNWHGMYSLFNSINANAFLNHVVVYVMPGEGMELDGRMSVEEARQRRPVEVIETARSREDPMIGFGVTTAEARTLVSMVSLSGVVYPLAGVMPELPADRLPLLQGTLPTMSILPLDLFSRGGDTDWDTFKHVSADAYSHHSPELIDLKVNAKSGQYDVVALPNWRSARGTRSFSFTAQLGLDPGQPYLAFDFWNQKLLGVFTNTMSLHVDGHDTRVVLLHPLLDRPQLLATSRHISGAFSVEDLIWDRRGRALRGVAEVVPEADYTLFFHLPHGRSLRARASASAGRGSVPVRQATNGDLLSVTFNSAQTPVSWEVRF